MNNILMSILAIGALIMPLSLLAADGDSAKTIVGDAVITSKVKLELAKAEDVSASSITVDTDSNGLVQLSGTAKSKVEAEKAVTLAKKVEGVTAVKNEITVVE